MPTPRSCLGMSLKLAYHILPLWPLCYGKLYLTLVSVLLVCLPYIKVMKISSQYREACQQDPTARLTQRLGQSRQFWLSWTFIKPPRFQPPAS